MERFYDFLSRGDSIVDAQRKAKLDFTGGRDTTSPYFWANIVVSGEAERKFDYP
jgi:CHAT domain-containing protein